MALPDPSVKCYVMLIPLMPILHGIRATRCFGCNIGWQWYLHTNEVRNLY